MSLDCQVEKLVITNIIDHMISQSIRLYIRHQDKQEIERVLNMMKHQNRGLKWRFEKVLIETS